MIVCNKNVGRKHLLLLNKYLYCLYIETEIILIVIKFNVFPFAIHKSINLCHTYIDFFYEYFINNLIALIFTINWSI